ncbi:MAG: hypothetical protein AAF212_13370, partial [Verrucomicrobiota bacterium]
FITVTIVYAILYIAASHSLSKSYALLEENDRPLVFDEVIPKELNNTENAALVYQAVALQLKAKSAGDTDYLSLLGELGQAILEDPTDQEPIRQFGDLSKASEIINALVLLESANDKKGSRYDIDYDLFYDAVVHHIEDLKLISQWICAHGLMHAKSGNISEAWDTAITALALGNATRDEPTIISQFTRIIQFEEIKKLIEFLIQNGEPSTEQLTQILPRLASYEDIQPLVRAYDAERIAANTALADLPLLRGFVSQYSEDADILFMLSPLLSPFITYDRSVINNVMLTFANEMIDNPQSPIDEATSTEIMNTIPSYSFIAKALTPDISNVKNRFTKMIRQAKILKEELSATSSNL